MTAALARLLPASLVAGGLCAWAMPSWLVVKKVLALLLMPAGLVWLGLFVLLFWPRLGGRFRVLVSVILAGYTLAGNPWLGAWMLRQLEAPYVDRSLVNEPFDAVCVFGGGSAATPTGAPQLGPAGDRLIVAARLYHTGKAKHLVATGLSVTERGEPRCLADDTAAIWRELGVPEAAITRLRAPRNTAEEVEALRELLTGKTWTRVAICSSAWHLRRIERLCQRENLNVALLPADFQSSVLPWSPLYAVPQSRGFLHIQKAAWEFLGALAAR